MKTGTAHERATETNDRPEPAIPQRFDARAEAAALCKAANMRDISVAATDSVVYVHFKRGDTAKYFTVPLAEYDRETVALRIMETK